MDVGSVLWKGAKRGSAVAFGAVLCVALALGGCADRRVHQAHVWLDGDATFVRVGVPIRLTAWGGCTCGGVEYRFSLGDGRLTDWTASPTVDVAWEAEGLYPVRVQARCVGDPSVETAWSGPRCVTVVAGHALSQLRELAVTPERNGVAGNDFLFVARGSQCSEGHGVEVRFSWGDGTVSDWGGIARVKVFHEAGEYEVRAQARCAEEHSILSPWSDPLVVPVSSLVP